MDLWLFIRIISWKWSCWASWWKICVCGGYMCVHVHLRVSTCVWRPEVNAGCFLQTTSMLLVFETRSEPKVCLRWLAGKFLVLGELAGLGCYIQCRVWMEVQERGNETGNPKWCPVCISEKHCHENWARGHLQVWEIFSTLRLNLVMQEDAALWCVASAGLMSAWLLRIKGSYTFPQEGQLRGDIVCHWEWEVVQLRQER